MVDVVSITVHEQILLSSLCSLVLVLGVISGAVNKAAFFMYLCVTTCSNGPILFDCLWPC
jgi:hypothetical protein